MEGPARGEVAGNEVASLGLDVDEMIALNGRLRAAADRVGKRSS